MVTDKESLLLKQLAILHSLNGTWLANFAWKFFKWKSVLFPSGDYIKCVGPSRTKKNPDCFAMLLGPKCTMYKTLIYYF